MIVTVQLVCREARHVDCTTYRNVRMSIQGKDWHTAIHGCYCACWLLQNLHHLWKTQKHGNKNNKEFHFEIPQACTRSIRISYTWEVALTSQSLHILQQAVSLIHYLKTVYCAELCNATVRTAHGKCFKTFISLIQCKLFGSHSYCILQ